MFRARKSGKQTERDAQEMHVRPRLKDNWLGNRRYFISDCDNFSAIDRMLAINIPRLLARFFARPRRRKRVRKGEAKEGEQEPRRRDKLTSCREHTNKRKFRLVHILEVIHNPIPATKTKQLNALSNSELIQLATLASTHFLSYFLNLFIFFSSPRLDEMIF
jgi:hypothetical protein